VKSFGFRELEAIFEIKQRKVQAMAEPLKEYEYMWDGSTSGWVLVQNDDARETGEYAIYNKVTKAVCIIEEVSVHQMVCEKLLSLGAEVLARMPRTEFQIENIEIEK